MSPWIIGGIVVYWAVAFYVASAVGQWLSPDRPERLRTRAVRTRARAGRVEVLPTLGDAENGRTRAGRGR